MRHLTPTYILQRAAQGQTTGTFDGVVLFVDTSGFTQLTVQLTEQGREGAEILADILLAVFDPLVRAVYAHGGFIAGFAGDAFKAVFPLGPETDAHQQALSVAQQIQTHMAQHPVYETKFGAFAFSVRLCLADGAVGWAIWSAEADTIAQRRGYTFSGAAIDAAIRGEDFAAGGELVVTAAVFTAATVFAATKQLSGEALTGEAAGYVRVGSMRGRKITTESAKKEGSESVHSNIKIHAGAADFYAPSLLATKMQGEFRSVFSVFVNVARLPDPKQPDDFVPLLLRLLDQYGGYLCRIGRIGANDPGGTFLLFWGAPTSHENDRHRVLSFLLELQAQAGVPMRAGVTHAVVYAGFIGSPLREEYTCYGSSVNQAARQMSAAKMGEMILDAAIAQQAADTYSIVPRGAVPFKGFATPQPIFQLRGYRAGDTERAYHNPFVGRQRELAALSSAGQLILAGEKRGLIVVKGDAGIGKSHLIYQMLHHDARWQAMQTFTCQCDEILRESLNPFRYFLRRYFGQQVDATEATNKTAFNQTLDNLIAATNAQALRAELARVRSIIGALVDLHWPDSLFEQLEPQLRFENYQTALQTLLVAECRRKPTVLIVEDTHWLDTDSLVMLRHLVEQLPSTTPLVMIATARPPTAGADVVISAEIIQQEIEVGLFSAEEIHILAQRHLNNTVTPDLAELLIARAEGNPFFAEQSLLYLQEETLIAPSANGWQLTTAIEPDTLLPDNIQAVLIARLDRLTQAVRGVVQTAAVLGREFSVQILSQMLNSDQELNHKVRSAQDAAIWSTLNELRYLFRHALMRDAAYDMQLRTRLRTLHHIAAQAIETLYADRLAPFYADLTYHYRQSDHADLERHYAKLAGEYSAKRYANADAISFFSRALELTNPSDVTLRYELLKSRLNLYRLTVQHDLRLADIEQLEQIAPQLPLHEQVVIRLARAKHIEQAGDVAQAATIIEELIERVDGAPALEAKLLSEWGWLASERGAYEEAQTRLRRSILLAEQSGDKPLLGASRLRLGVLHLNRGMFQKASAAFEEALALFRSLKALHYESKVLNNLAISYVQQGQFDRAQVVAHEALDLYQRTGDVRGISYAYNNLSIIYFYQGDLSQALHYMELWGVMLQRLQSPSANSRRLNNMGVIYLTVGAYEIAQTTFEAALEIDRQFGRTLGECYVLSNLGLVAYYLGEFEQAKAHCEQAIKLARKMQARSDEGNALTNLGRALYGLQQYAAAQTCYQQAAAIRAELGQSALRIETLAGSLEVALAVGNRPTIETLATEISHYLDTNGTQGMLEPFHVYAQLYSAWATLNDPQAAPCLQHAFHQLQQHAKKISNETMRSSYLSTVTSHQLLVAMYIEQYLNRP